MSPDDSVTLAVAGASVEVVPAVGGAIAAFRCDGADVLRPTSPEARVQRTVRGFGCYPLVPYSNRIACATLEVDGMQHPLARNFGADHPHAIHGVGWQRRWRVVSRDAARVLLALEHRPHGEDALAWPFGFRAWQSIALSRHGDASLLSLTMTIESCDARPFPIGLGWHPFFPRDASTELGFAATGLWATDATGLPTQRQPVAPPLDFDPPRAIGATTLDNVFTGWRGRATLRWPHLRRNVTLDADRSLGFLVVYVPAGRDFIAVEPVSQMTDAFNRAARGAPDTGTIVLAPGASRCCTMRIVSHPDARRSDA